MKKKIHLNTSHTHLKNILVKNCTNSTLGGVSLKNNFILCKGGIGSIGVFYGLCTEFLSETKS